MSDIRSWLDARLADAPEGLGDAVQRVACSVQRGAPAGEVATALVRGAEALLVEAADGPPTRETALTLLAADALMTLACEWTTERDPGSLGDLT